MWGSRFGAGTGLPVRRGEGALMLLISAMAPEYPGAARCPGHPPPNGCRFPAFEAEVSEQRGESGPRRASFIIPRTSVPRLPPLIRACERRHVDARNAILLARSPCIEQEVESRGQHIGAATSATIAQNHANEPGRRNTRDIAQPISHIATPSPHRLSSSRPRVALD